MNKPLTHTPELITRKEYQKRKDIQPSTLSKKISSGAIVEIHDPTISSIGLIDWSVYGSYVFRTKKKKISESDRAKVESEIKKIVGKKAREQSAKYFKREKYQRYK